jgi:hypothetical protein
MKSKKFELFMGCLGNGITVCNKAVEENGDYKIIAHISNAGNIKLYVSENYIPFEDMEKIKAAANKNKEIFQSGFEKLPILKQYEVILDSLAIEEMLLSFKDKRPLEEKIIDMRKTYYKNA